MIIVEKRDGTQVPFNSQKIIEAINKAFLEVDGQLYEDDTAKDIALDIEQYCLTSNQNHTNIPKLNELFQFKITVEAIQNKVEELLMRSERPDVARAYIRYRYKKEVAREIKSDFFDAIGEKLEARNVQNQNANVDEHSFGGRIGEASSYMTKQYALDNLVSKMARENHEGNMIYIHDLDAYAVGSHNCLSIPFDDLLAKGFNTRQTDVRPAGSVNTAFQLVAVIFQLQSLQQFGGVSATHLDWTMVPYVRKSFWKHYMDGLDFVWDPNIKDAREPTRCFLRENINPVDTSIDAHIYKTAGQEHPYPCVNSIYNYAMKMTKREVHQAVEGMYHNLNTLQSRSGNQLN